MQEFRDEWNENRINKLEERINLLQTVVSNEQDHNTMIFKSILEAFDAIQKITKNLEGRVWRLENAVLLKGEDEEDS